MYLNNYDLEGNLELLKSHFGFVLIVLGILILCLSGTKKIRNFKTDPNKFKYNMILSFAFILVGVLMEFDFLSLKENVSHEELPGLYLKCEKKNFSEIYLEDIKRVELSASDKIVENGLYEFIDVIGFCLASNYPLESFGKGTKLTTDNIAICNN